MYNVIFHAGGFPSGFLHSRFRLDVLISDTEGPFFGRKLPAFGGSPTGWMMLKPPNVMWSSDWEQQVKEGK